MMALEGLNRSEREEMLALLELRRARAAKDDLNEYCKYIEIPGVPILDEGLKDDPDAPVGERYPDTEQFYCDSVTPAKHHELVNNTLMDVERGQKRRVMIFMPPGSAKSTYGTVSFPTWFMGKKKGRHIISCSYGQDLATRFGRKCRTIVNSRKYREVFGTCMTPGNRAASDWSLENQSTYMSRGIEGGITGNRADGIVIDDPVKGRKDADSPTIRETVWQEYLAAVRTRLKPRGFVVIIQTRWHADDLSGRILPTDWSGQSGWVTAKDGEQWYVICLAAECEREGDPLGRKVGEYLWTDWFPVEHWEQEKKSQGSRNWASLYQQRPSLDDGGVWVLKWFQRYMAQPEGKGKFLIVQSWDTGNKPQEINDPSCCTTWLVTEHGIYLLHLWKDQVNFPDLKRNAINLAIMWQPDVIVIEDKASGQSLIQELREVPISDTKGLILSVIAIEPEGDKLARAQAVAPMIESQKVYLPTLAPWLPDLELEITTFPNSPKKDQVDSISQGLNWIKKHAVLGERVISSGTRVGIQAAGPTSDSSAADGNLLGSDTGGFL